MTKLHEAIEEASRLAAQTNGCFRHGCVILEGKKIVARGNNHVRTNIGTSSIHAEMDALWKIQNSDAHSNLKAVIIRISKTGQFGNSRPCDMCYSALKQHGVKTIVYSSVGGRIAMEKM
ncbi:cytidine and deoxycytidylate deaminase [Paramecium bursaria Chlorella virus NE-JV-1]|nr:cytidine and deoxycytidylate deaminase [Paramecium bursaria Chlorella virus NE-JV-1]